MTRDSSRTVVVIKPRRTSALCPGCEGDGGKVTQAEDANGKTNYAVFFNISPYAISMLGKSILFSDSHERTSTHTQTSAKSGRLTRR